MTSSFPSSFSHNAWSKKPGQVSRRSRPTCRLRRRSTRHRPRPSATTGPASISARTPATVGVIRHSSCPPTMVQARLLSAILLLDPDRSVRPDSSAAANSAIIGSSTGTGWQASKPMSTMPLCGATAPFLCYIRLVLTALMRAEAWIGSAPCGLVSASCRRKDPWSSPRADLPTARPTRMPALPTRGGNDSVAGTDGTLLTCVANTTCLAGTGSRTSAGWTVGSRWNMPSGTISVSRPSIST